MFDSNAVKPAERNVMQRWIATTFCGSDRVSEIKVIRNFFGPPRMNRSMSGGKIIIADQKFDRGLGAHADSELFVSLPRPAKRLLGKVGVDTTASTLTGTCRIVFSVEARGRVIWQSLPLAAGDKCVDIPGVNLGGVSDFTLKAISPDGNLGWAHADWANLQVELADESHVWLDEIPLSTTGPVLDLPFSFSLDGEHSAHVLMRSRKEVTTEDRQGYRLHRLKWLINECGLELTCELKEYQDYPAAEWVLFFKNTGVGNSPIISDVVPYNVNLSESERIVLHGLHGSACTSQDYMPFKYEVNYRTEGDADLGHYNMSSIGGRPNQIHFPFWNLEATGQGIITGMGWSGNWQFNMDMLGGSTPKVCAAKVSMPQIRCYLKPGEHLRTARMLMLYWQGSDLIRAHNLFRRLMRTYYTPSWYGEEPIRLVAVNTHFAHQGVGVNEENQLTLIDDIAAAGAENYWLDAGYHHTSGAWYEGMGNWRPDEERFPNGLRRIGKRVHEKGMRFILWFEPERICAGSKIYREHPEWLVNLPEHARAGAGIIQASAIMLNIGIPEARQYLIDEISSLMEEGGVDVYRADFNYDPAAFWEAADEPGRQGITENKYIEGLYLFWDALKSRFPHIFIDNCASGSRRLDLETSMRGITLWRSDAQVDFSDPYGPDKSQSQTMGLSYYLPAHAGGVNALDTYSVRSATTQAFMFGLPGRHLGNIPIGEYRKAFAETKMYRHLFYADYYPLTEVSSENTAWAAFQYNSPELGEGFVLAFRREKSPFVSAEFALQGLDPDGTYEITDVDAGTTKFGWGRELERLDVNLPSKGSKLFLYRLTQTKERR